MDFTQKTYKELLSALKEANYTFLTFADYCQGKRADNYVILRHDVDLLPQNSLQFAQIQAAMGVKGSYYFRAVPESWDEEVIKEIRDLGHEVGYHYENLSTTAGDLEKGIADFEENLKALRKLVEVKTICMEGAPLSKYDNRDLWKSYHYQDYGIIGEPYFDVNFDDVFYLTDTGRRWDGWKVSVRDKVPQQDQWQQQGLVFHSTQDIIDAALRLRGHGAESRSLSTSTSLCDHGAKSRSLSGAEVPDKLMMTFHPQRWHDKPLSWMKELLVQNVKNMVKRFMVRS